MTFLELAEKIVREENRPLTPEEIWQIACAKQYDAAVGSQGKTPWSSIGAQLYVSVKTDSKSQWMRVGKRPSRFYLKELNTSGQYSATTSVTVRPASPVVSVVERYLEKDLHCLLTYFAFHNLRAYCKTIIHSKSRKDEFGEWVHPDMVGVYYPLDDWEDVVVELNRVIGSVSVRLFSFELKRDLNFSNLREAFFQSVSNSSWANEGYVVAAEISQDEEFQSELQRLSTSFGIGVIQLSPDDPDSSKIIYPAKQKEYLDWETINKLTLNADFSEFLDRVKKDLTGKEIRMERYDKVLEADAIKKSFTRGI